MQRHLPTLVLFSALSLAGALGVSCGGGATAAADSHPATEAGARALLEAFVAPGADVAQLSAQLRPRKEDYVAVYGAEAGAKIADRMELAWEQGQVVVKGKEGQTQVLLASATSEELKSGTGKATEFPGGYADVAGHLQPGLTLYRFKFVAPGEELGMAYDGLVHVNGRWALIPKPWRALAE